MRLESSSSFSSKSNSRGRSAASIAVPRLMFLSCVVALVAIGLVMVYSASSIEAYTDYGDAAYFLKRQALMLLLAVTALVVVARFIPFSLWRNGRLPWIVWWIAVLALIATDIFGYIGLGARRWIYIGPISIQPSEFAKIAVLVLSAYLIAAYRSGELGTFRQFILKMLVVILFPAVLIIIQPDLGTTLVLLAGVVVVLWFGQVSRKLIFGSLVAIVVLAVAAVLLVGFRSSRLDAWLDPWSNQYGSGYQIVNSFYAFAEGGIFGVGLGNSTQKYLYLTYAYNDFIFAIIGEELGLIGAILIIALFLVFLLSAFRIGRTSSDLFGTIVCNSMAGTIVFQAFLNIACVTGVLPVTGKPLPFISYGGSSLITSMIMVGFVLAVSLQNSEDEPERRRRRIQSVAGNAPPDIDYRQKRRASIVAYKLRCPCFTTLKASAHSLTRAYRC